MLLMLVRGRRGQNVPQSCNLHMRHNAIYGCDLVGEVLQCRTIFKVLATALHETVDTVNLFIILTWARVAFHISSSH